MSVIDTLLGKARRSPRGRKIVAMDPRAVVKRRRQDSKRRLGVWGKLLKR